jgi:cysteine desulfuration protein SufE
MGQFGGRTNRKVNMVDINIPTSLREIIEEFQFCEGREKLELLIQYSESLPPLPNWLTGHEQMNLVQECMTPVYVQAEIDDQRHMVFHFEVPAESPTVRGFANVMKKGLDGSTPAEILQIPADFFHEMGLHLVLSHQRLNGISAILAYMKQLAVKQIQA